MPSPSLSVVLPDVRSAKRGHPREIRVRIDPMGLYIDLIGQHGEGPTTFCRVQNESGGVWVTVWADTDDAPGKKLVWG